MMLRPMGSEGFHPNNHFDISWAGDDNFHLLWEIISRKWPEQQGRVVKPAV